MNILFRRQVLIQKKIRKNQIIRERIARNQANIQKNYLLCCCMESVGLGKEKSKMAYNCEGSVFRGNIYFYLVF